MTPSVWIIIFCGLVIALAIYLLIRSLRKMAKGRCCEGCDGCSQADHCSSREASEGFRRKRKDDIK